MAYQSCEINEIRSCNVGINCVAILGESPESLNGLYVLRHLVATDFGSRDRCPIGEMRRWLGHTASSSMADIYVQTVLPENRIVVE